MRSPELTQSLPAPPPMAKVSGLDFPATKPADLALAYSDAPRALSKEVLAHAIVPIRPMADSGPREPWKVAPWIEAVQREGRLNGGLASLDTETTGFGGTTIEVAVIGEAGKPIYHAYVLPQEPIDPEATKVHRLTEEILIARRARPWSEVAPELREVLREHPTILAYSYNFFDKTVLEHSDEVAGIEPTAAGVRWVDVMDPYQNANGLHKGMKLVEAAEVMGVDLRKEDAHGAVADAAATMGVFKGLANHRLELPAGQFLLHKGTEGLEAFDAKGQRLDIAQDNLQEALNLESATWGERLKRGMESVEKGAYIKMSLPVVPGFGHLSRVPAGSTLIAWHRRADAQAVRLPDGQEALFIDGQKIALEPARHYRPAEVINILVHCDSWISLLDHIRAFKDLK